MVPVGADLGAVLAILNENDTDQRSNLRLLRKKLPPTWIVFCFTNFENYYLLPMDV